SSRRRHTRFSRDWSSDVCSSDLLVVLRRRLRSLVLGVGLGVGRLLGLVLSKVFGLLDHPVHHLRPGLELLLPEKIIEADRLASGAADEANLGRTEHREGGVQRRPGLIDVEVRRSEERRVGKRWRTR